MPGPTGSATTRAADPDETTEIRKIYSQLDKPTVKPRKGTGEPTWYLTYGLTSTARGLISALGDDINKFNAFLVDRMVRPNGIVVAGRLKDGTTIVHYIATGYPNMKYKMRTVNPWRLGTKGRTALGEVAGRKMKAALSNLNQRELIHTPKGNVLLDLDPKNWLRFKSKLSNPNRGALARGYLTRIFVISAIIVAAAVVSAVTFGVGAPFAILGASIGISAYITGEVVASKVIDEVRDEREIRTAMPIEEETDTLNDRAETTETARTIQTTQNTTRSPSGQPSSQASAVEPHATTAQETVDQGAVTERDTKGDEENHPKSPSFWASHHYARNKNLSDNSDAQDNHKKEDTTQAEPQEPSGPKSSP